MLKLHTIKMYGGIEAQFHTFLIMALDGGEWSASCPSHFTPMKETPVYMR
jgi:hypothetical protein